MRDFKKYLPAFVYGGSDGAVSYFTLMAGAYGAGLPIAMLIAIGISNVVADAFSMATADYLSEDSRKNESQNEKNKNAFVTFLAFILIASLPIAPSIYAYFIYGANTQIPLSIFLYSTILTIIGFTVIGYLRGKVLKRNIFKTILQSILICSISAFVAYYVGEYAAKLFV
jgi:hypothetical protein